MWGHKSWRKGTDHRRGEEKLQLFHGKVFQFRGEEICEVSVPYRGISQAGRWREREQVSITKKER